MPDLGVRELKARASEIIRSVRDNRARYTITYRGRPVGVLMPLEQSRTEPVDGDLASAASAWDELVRLGVLRGLPCLDPGLQPERVSQAHDQARADACCFLFSRGLSEHERHALGYMVR